ncbi:hypothetical protein AM588_10011263 [Phytophthora nicotianae]|uniref:Dynein heavy chain n=1 Tax=Phytophthora nicotianae TaxID=4792 RepID=A0A0W8DB10_PHYNI|nr:hypothetical protein AM588_10011263 [Phytophthora nicotianae]
MDPDSDARHSYLAGLLRGLWAPRNTRLSENKPSQQALTQFLDDLQCNVLYARLACDSDEISLANTLQDEEGGNNDETAAFLKLHKATPLHTENMSTNVQLTSALQTPLQSLYQTVHQVYAPLLLRDDARASLLSQKLKDVLLELDAGLAGTVLLQGGSDAKKSKSTPIDGDEGLMSIATMSDEFAYWEAMQDDSRQARRAKKFSAVFDTVHQRFSAPLGDLSFDDMTDLLDDASNVADDLWPPIETQVAVVLRERLRAVTSKPSAAARMLQRYQHLLQRPTLAQALAGERDALLAQLLAHVDQLDSDFETRKQYLSSSTGAREKSGMHVGKTLSSDVNVIVWAHALGRRVADTQRLARGVLTDLPALPRLSQQCDKLAAKANGLVLDRVRDWQESMLRALDDDDDNNGGQSLRLRGRLMQIDKQSGDLVVNFSEFLVTLLRDVRQLTELSSQQPAQSEAWVPTRVRQVAEEAEKYYRFGVTLQKVANFYNSIEAQIIDEQKPMLLDSLLAFEDAVQRPGIAQSNNQKTKSKDVTWANLDECDEYHYDWGLRALKAVLNTAGKLLQAEKKDRATAGKSSEESKEPDKPVRMTTAEETEILIKAVRINTLSKLTFVDSTRFLALIGDVFPGVESADLAGGALGDAIRDVMTSKPFFLQVDDLQIRKMLQLKESLDQRMGCVVVGPSGSGKSTVWQVLQQALIRCGQLVKTHVMNPKSMPRERLLGHMDLDTREWEDGVLTAAARQVVKEPENVRSWIICDGDVDPEWIESLNSVLDDNHLLTLPNGERINFGPNVNFVFETHDLRFASPATISRMGMIFLSDEDMAIERLVSKWLLTLPPASDPSTSNTRDALKQWIDELFTRGLEELHKYEAIVATTTVGTIMNGLSHVATATTRSEFVCAMIRGLGANLAMGSRASFAKSLFMMANERPPDVNNPLDCYCQGSTFYTYETKRDTYGAMDGKMDRKDLVVNGMDAVVPTVSVQRGLKLIEPWVDKMEPFILVGPEGSGKNMLIRQAFKNLKSVTVSVLHCNAQTTADHVIHKIAQCCSLFSTPTGRVYRPRDAERLVLYLKDINLPKPDQYDTCMLIAFLQQLITFNGFYDQHLEFLGVEKIQLVASMNAATTVGRHPLSTRFTAIVKVAYMDYPSTEELSVVYSTFLEGVFDSSNTPNLPATWRDPANRDRLAKSMVEVYDTVKTKFSVDEQRHYLFTPRDLTKWIFALVRYDLEHEDVLDALAHEARRLFRDRLVDNETKAKFDGILNSVWKQQWRHAAKLQDVYFSSLHCRSTEAGNTTMTAPLQRIASDEFSQVVTQGMVLYEREEKDLHMLLFDEILEHLTIVERVLSEPGGSMLLVGNSGVGRRSATTLISYMLNYTMFSPSITRNYDAGSFRTDLKSLLVKAGVEGQHYVLYLEDHHFTQDAILELTNSLLSSGEVPGLYTHEEIEPQIAPLKELMLESIGATGQEHIRTVYDFFVSRVRQFVHVVLGMDARNPQFVLRCESNPALYTRCAIVWMGEWNSSSMARLPELLLSGSELVDSLIKTTPLITSLYASCKEFGATPREFICFLNTWRTLFEAKCKQIVQEIRHLKSGLSKLEEASVTVDELSRNAVLKKKDLSAAQVSADEAMKEITNALDRAATNRREVEDLKKQLAKAETATNARKREIEQELSEITPILQTAMEAVGNIKSDNLNEIRSLKMPPEPIHDVLSAVLMLLGIQDTSWNSMKKFLGNRGVKEDILNYDAHRITPEISKAVTKLVKSKTSSFDHETIYRVSVAAAPLATWVKANLKYSMVLNKIEPLETDLAEAKRSLEASQQRLLQCESELKKIDITVDQMKVQFGEKTKEAEILRVNLEQAQSTLNKAQGLLGKLGGEKHRWSEQVKELENRLTDLPVRMLLASAFTTFLGKCSEDARKRVVKEWERDILESINPTGPASSLHFDYRKLLSTESELLTWKSMGLPSDNLSMENALIVSNSSGERCPFIIDPASASTTWLQAELAKDTTRPLSIVQSQDARFVNLVEQAVRFGKTLVILEVDNVEPYLYPLVRKDLIHQGPRFVVALGDKVIDYNENFRLYLVTRKPSPPLAPDALAIVNVVNFTVTKSGLEGQLLGVTIQHEQPELEQEKSELLRQEEECKVQLAALEKQLVEALATSEGDILENTMLVESLTKTKATSAEIENALERSAKKSEELDEKRDTYSPFAREGAKMFFLVKQLSAVNHMYRFSLASFLDFLKPRWQRKWSLPAPKTVFYA